MIRGWVKLFIKAIGWRVISTGIIFIISFLVTRSLDIAFSIASIEFVVKLLAYMIYDKLWGI